MTEIQTNGGLIPIQTTTSNISISSNSAGQKPLVDKKKVQADGTLYNMLDLGKNKSYMLGVRTELSFFQNYYLKMNGFLALPRQPFPYQSEVERIKGKPQDAAHVFLDGAFGIGYKDNQGLNIFSAN